MYFYPWAAHHSRCIRKQELLVMSNMGPVLNSSCLLLSRNIRVNNNWSSIQWVLQFGNMSVAFAQHCNFALFYLWQYVVIGYAQWLGLCRSLDTNLF